MAQYYMHGIPIKDTIRNIGCSFINTKGEEETTSIYDYCIARKKTRSCEYYSIEKGISKPEKNKVLRYYISDTQNQLLKKFIDGKKKGQFQQINKGFGVNMFNDYYDSDDYNINYAYYENECHKLMEPIRIGTMRLEQPFAEQLKMF